MSRKILLLLLIAIFYKPATATTTTPPLLLDEVADGDLTPVLGTNLSPVIYYSSEYVFVDAFKMSRQWITQDINGMSTDEFDQLDLDANGWVRSLPDLNDPDVDYRFVATVMLWEIGDHFPQGDYTIFYDGTYAPEVAFAGESVSYDTFLLAQQNRQLPSDYYFVSPDKQTVTYLTKPQLVKSGSKLSFPPENRGVFVRISQTDPDDYTRNIRIIMPGFEETYGTEPFHPDFLEMLSPYQVIRFMDWMRTNETESQTWAERPRAANSTYGSEKGVPVETMVALANTLASEPWFTLPHRATNAYMNSFATYVRNNLDEGLDVYIEFSNEVWNSHFPQGDWIQEQAVNLWDDVGYSDYSKRMIWYGMRTAEMCDIWKDNWGADSNRIHCVVGGHATVTWYMENHILPCPLWEEAPCSDHGLTEIAIAPYFGNYIGALENEAEIESWLDESDGGFDSLFTELLEGDVLVNSPAGGAVAAAIANAENYMAVAQSNGMPLITYEGGQHLVGTGGVQNNPLIAEFFNEANHHPRMGEVYSLYGAGWQEASLGGLLVHFSSSGRYTEHGSWGAMEYMDEGTTPKYNALVAYRNSALDQRIYLPIVAK